MYHGATHDTISTFGHHFVTITRVKDLADLRLLNLLPETFMRRLGDRDGRFQQGPAMRIWLDGVRHQSGASDYPLEFVHESSKRVLERQYSGSANVVRAVTVRHLRSLYFPILVGLPAHGVAFVATALSLTSR